MEMLTSPIGPALKGAIDNARDHRVRHPQKRDHLPGDAHRVINTHAPLVHSSTGLGLLFFLFFRFPKCPFLKGVQFHKIHAIK